MYIKAQSFGINLIAFYLIVCLVIFKNKLPWIDITLKPTNMQNFVSFGQEMTELHNTKLYHWRIRASLM